MSVFVYPQGNLPPHKNYFTFNSASLSWRTALNLYRNYFFERIVMMKKYFNTPEVTQLAKLAFSNLHNEDQCNFIRNDFLLVSVIKSR